MQRTMNVAVLAVAQTARGLRKKDRQIQQDARGRQPGAPPLGCGGTPMMTGRSRKKF